MRHRMALLVMVTAAAVLPGLRADEGLWLFNRFPKELVQQKYGFEVTDAWLDHLRLASVRFNNGGSASFVSPGGLLFTNHHVGLDCIQKLSSADHDYVANGYYARTQAEERACPDLEVNVLLRMEDVTQQVQGAAKPEAAPAEANRQRKAEMSRLEKECTGRTGNRCEVVTLYSGGAYHLYEYKKYTDVRLVFAPELGIAQFGGDPDNFTYPRYCLDFSFFRAYENGRPAQVKEWLRWSREGVREGELTFASGHPGTTGRLATYAELEFFRDESYPFVQERLAGLIRALEAYSAQGAENRRVAQDNLWSKQNGYKAYTGFLAGLRDAELMREKRWSDARLRAALARDPAKEKEFGGVWDEVAAAYGQFRGFYRPFLLLERSAAMGSELFAIARDVLRYAEETAKPDAQRLRQFADANLSDIEQEMYSPAPLSDSMEIAVLAEYFGSLRRYLGEADPVVKAVLEGRTPEEAARAYVTTSKLKDVAERKRLARDAAAARTSEDGMIRLARLIDGPARLYRKQYEDQVEAVLAPSNRRIAQARFAVYGASEYPDATFTLRLTYAPVIGYTNQAGQSVPWATRFQGLYERATGQDPYRLPPRWLQAKSALNLWTQFDFVTTADTHGGNSGSPTVNRAGEIVGIVFDGNLEGLPLRFFYSEVQARSVHVASQGIVEALRKVYQAKRLLKEIGME
ncbi:MAG: S46 family peptidase [Bryobacteraceae bacterium]